jgi:CRISPR-associated protein Csm1
LLDSDGKWDEPKFVINESITGEQGVCVLCKKHPVLEGKENCRQCEQEVRIGRVLTAARYIAFYHDVKNGYTVLGRSFEIWDKFQTRQEPYLIIELNNHSSARTMPRCMANHVPLGCDITCHEHQHEPETPVTFGCIAGAAHGEQRLGYMKADVDNMGLIFREGFLDKVPQGKFVIANIRPSISRFTALSRMVEYFFSGYLQQCLTKDYRDIYTVFSGGDDFFLIGPWDRLIDLASHQREKFRAYTAQNPDFSFSAGLITAKPDEPLSFTSHHAEAALVMAKAEYLKDHFSLFIKSAGITDLPLNLMDAVTKEKSATPLNKPVRWNEVTAIIGEARKLMQWIDQKQMTMGLVHNLWKYGTMYLEYDKTKDNRLLKAIPSLVYDIKRNVNGPDQQLARDWLNALVGSFGSSTGDGLWPYLRLIMDYALTYTRSGANAHKEM